MSTKKLVLFWGCRGRAGHFLHRPGGGYLDRSHECDPVRVPHPAALDGSPIFLPFPERQGEGALTYLPANDRTILAWWGSPFDRRGKVNSAIITEGQSSAEECWRRFSEAFPDLAPKLSMPKVLTSLGTTIDPRQIEHLRQRVEKTVCQTFDGETGETRLEGRISREDFDCLMIHAEYCARIVGSWEPN